MKDKQITNNFMSLTLYKRTKYMLYILYNSIHKNNTNNNQSLVVVTAQTTIRFSVRIELNAATLTTNFAFDTILSIYINN